MRAEAGGRGLQGLVQGAGPQGRPPQGGAGGRRPPVPAQPERPAGRMPAAGRGGIDKGAGNGV